MLESLSGATLRYQDSQVSWILKVQPVESEEVLPRRVWVASYLNYVQVYLEMCLLDIDPGQ